MALTNDPNYKKLEQWYRDNAGSLNMRDMFDADKDRFSKFRLGETLWYHEGGRGGGGGDGRGGGRDADRLSESNITAVWPSGSAVDRRYNSDNTERPVQVSGWCVWLGVFPPEQRGSNESSSPTWVTRSPFPMSPSLPSVPKRIVPTRHFHTCSVMSDKKYSAGRS